MAKRGGLALVAFALLMAGCASQKTTGHIERPSPEEMRQALKVLLDERPDISIPEFEISLTQSPVTTTGGGLVRIGSFYCDMDALMFDASFTAPNLPLHRITGHFELDARHKWRARLLGAKIVTAQDPNRRDDWHPSDKFSWSLGANNRR